MVEPLVIERKKLFEHVAAHLEAQILAGKLRPGDQLPPERDLQLTLRRRPSGNPRGADLAAEGGAGGTHPTGRARRC